MQGLALCSSSRQPDTLAGGRAIKLCAIALLAFLACGSSSVMAQWPWGGGGWGGGGGLFGGGGGWGGGGYRPDDNAGSWLREREMMRHQRIRRRPSYVHTKPQIMRVLPRAGPRGVEQVAPR